MILNDLQKSPLLIDPSAYYGAITPPSNFASVNGTTNIQANPLGPNIAQTAGSSFCASYYSGATYADFESWVSMTGASQRFDGPLGRIGSPGASFTGYAAAVDMNVGQIVLLRFDAGAATQIGSQGSYSGLSPRDIVLLRGIGSQLEVWTQRSGVWERNISVASGTYTSGYVGCGFNLSTTSSFGSTFRTFGGGSPYQRPTAPAVAGRGATW